MGREVLLLLRVAVVVAGCCCGGLLLLWQALRTRPDDVAAGGVTYESAPNHDAQANLHKYPPESPNSPEYFLRTAPSFGAQTVHTYP